MNGLDLRTLARALGGEVTGRQVVAPGPGHSRRDRSLSVRLSTESTTGFIVFSHAGDPFDQCRDYVMQKLGMDVDAWRTRGRGAGRPAPVFAVVEGGETSDHASRISRARALWREAVPAQGTVVEAYLRSRGLHLPDGADALRYLARCPWRDEEQGRTILVPCMVACMRQVAGNLITAIHRTRLSPEGEKLGRRMLGVAAGAAVKIDGDAEVATSLAIGEGIESVLSGRQFGFRPVWAMGSAGGISALPALVGVEALTVFEENDDTNRSAVETCAARWHRAGRTITIVTPNVGNDMNDALRSVA